jgi:hypothetical protein
MPSAPEKQWHDYNGKPLKTQREGGLEEGVAENNI